MNPFFMFLLAIFSPLLLALVLLAPMYLALAGASYLIYLRQPGTNPLHDKFFDVFYMIEAYQTLFMAWLSHMKAYSLLYYSAPLLILPLVGIAIALWLTAKLSRKLMDVFHLAAGQ